jgi:hypothetical protein
MYVLLQCSVAVSLSYCACFQYSHAPLQGIYDGSVAVTFADSSGAKACAKAMHGRWFDGRQIEVEIRGKFEGSLDIVQLGTVLLPLEPESEHDRITANATASATTESSSNTAATTASTPSTATGTPDVPKDSTPDDDLMALLSSV